MLLGGDFVDRRIVKTKRLLENALVKLMIEKGFDKISIKDLTEEADINRGTFYLHYKDKYDLLEQK
jgi:AcrR family transcriptional regulator